MPRPAQRSQTQDRTPFKAFRFGGHLRTGPATGTTRPGHPADDVGRQASDCRCQHDPAGERSLDSMLG